MRHAIMAALLLLLTAPAAAGGALTPVQARTVVDEVTALIAKNYVFPDWRAGTRSNLVEVCPAPAWWTDAGIGPEQRASCKERKICCDLFETSSASGSD